MKQEIEKHIEQSYRWKSDAFNRKQNLIDDCTTSKEIELTEYKVKKIELEIDHYTSIINAFEQALIKYNKKEIASLKSDLDNLKSIKASTKKG